MKATLEGDLVTGFGDGDLPYPEIPAPLVGLPSAALRWDGSALVDVRSVSTWYVDDRGRKHIEDADGRQALSCAWDAKLIDIAGEWRAKTAAEVLAPLVKRQCTARIRAVIKDDSTQRNMTAYASDLVAIVAVDGGTLTIQQQADLTLLRSARAWVEGMQTACRDLIEDADDTFSSDEHWPAAPEGLAELAERF